MLGIKDYQYFRTERLNNQYTFNPFDKSEPLNLSDFTMKLIEELRFLLLWLELNLGIP